MTTIKPQTKDKQAKMKLFRDINCYYVYLLWIFLSHSVSEVHVF